MTGFFAHVMLASIASVAPSSDATEAAASEERPHATWNISVLPFSLLWGGVHLEVERRLSPRLSAFVQPVVQVGGGITSRWVEGGIDARGFGGYFGLRVFPWGAAPTGFHVGPDVGVLYYPSVRVGSDVASGVATSVNALAGYTHRFDVGLTLGAGAGATVMVTRVNPGNLPTTLVEPGLRFAVGYAFDAGR